MAGVAGEPNLTGVQYIHPAKAVLGYTFHWNDPKKIDLRELLRNLDQFETTVETRESMRYLHVFDRRSAAPPRDTKLYGPR